MVPILDEQMEVTFAYCRSWSIGEDDQRFGFADSYLGYLDANHWTANFIVDGVEECRRFFVLSAPVPNASSVLFRKDVYETVGRADEGLRLCGDYKVFAAMAVEGKIAYLAEPLNYYRSHRENARTRTAAGALGIAEYFYVMLSVLDRVAPVETLNHKTEMNEILSRPPFKLNPPERIAAARQSLTYIADWNLCHNPHVPAKAMRTHFMNWEFALADNEFAISPPSRWRFFLHRCRFLQKLLSRNGLEVETRKPDASARSTYCRLPSQALARAGICADNSNAGCDLSNQARKQRSGSRVLDGSRGNHREELELKAPRQT